MRKKDKEIEQCLKEAEQLSEVHKDFTLLQEKYDKAIDELNEALKSQGQLQDEAGRRTGFPC